MKTSPVRTPVAAPRNTQPAARTQNTRPTIPVVVAPLTTSSTGFDISSLSDEEIAAIRARCDQVDEAKFKDLEAVFETHFTECQNVLGLMRQIKGYENHPAPWENHESPQACAYAIKRHLQAHDGTSTTAEIVEAVQGEFEADKITRTLANRRAGNRPLWTFDEATDAYTLKKGKA